ncbi:hypothetical protein Clacol_008897 [Clathrus columnatus]|uniref:NADP-dependent oxidoreductase domain-containing protein n=1 Tax=Clathrus columnatus TaxID=1419009 RepID=A0AAV5AQH4_9AGAM|nr:hypothetical protein Clacol_008897 [Clathrus columnatus]
MTSKVPIYTLNNGVEIPGLGENEYQIYKPNFVLTLNANEQDWVAGPGLLKSKTHQDKHDHDKNGYKHMDTAYGYGTEPYVGKAIRAVGIPREDIFVTTKLPNHHHDRVAESLDISLTRAGFDYYDLPIQTYLSQYLVHWPQAWPFKGEDNESRLPDGSHEVVEHPNINETWEQMEKLLETDKVRAIGVSNFSVKNLKQLLTTAKIVPAVNQVEMHPHQNQKELKEFCDSKGILLTAYSPTGYQHVATDHVVVEIAKKHNASSAQVVLAWHLARGTSAVPKSTSSKHQIENLNPPTLDAEDIDKLNSLHKNVHYCDYGEPRNKVFGWTYEQMGW